MNTNLDTLFDIVDPICSYRTSAVSHYRTNAVSHYRTNAVENTEYYLLRCSYFANQRTVLFDDLRNIGINYSPLDSSILSRMLLFGNPNFNSGIIYAVIEFIDTTNRFSGSIYD